MIVSHALGGPGNDGGGAPSFEAKPPASDFRYLRRHE